MKTQISLRGCLTLTGLKYLAYLLLPEAGQLQCLTGTADSASSCLFGSWPSGYMAAAVLLSLHRVLIQNSTSQVAPAKILMRPGMWLFSRFTKHTLRHRGGDHITDYVAIQHSITPQPVLQVTSLSKILTLYTQRFGWAIPQLWLLLSRGTVPSSHLFP